MISIFAHGFGGTNGLPLPRWLLAYTTGFAVVLAFVALRALQPNPASHDREATAAEGAPRSPRRPLLVATRAIGVALFAAVFVAAAAGIDDSAANIAPVTVIVLFWLGMQLASVVLGDVFWWLDPFATIATLLPRRGASQRAPDGHWTAAGLLFAFVWFVFAYPEFYPPTPHEVAWFIAVYTVAVVTGVGLWGRDWVRDGEAFGALFGLLGRRRRPASSGTIALLCVYLGSILFDGISQTNWWIDVLGTSRGWHERVLNTLGLSWSIAIVAMVYVGASRLAARLAGRDPVEIAVAFAPALVPLGFAWSVAHYVSAFLLDIQNFYALASDPLGRGWDLFGTIDYLVNYRVLTPLQTGWFQTAVVLGGCLLSAAVIHRTTLTRYRTKQGVRVTYPLAAAVVAAAVGAVGLLLGT